MGAQILHFAAFHKGSRPVPPSNLGIRVMDQEDYVEIVTTLPNGTEDDIIIGIIDGVLTIGAKVHSEEQHDFGGILVIDHAEKSIEQSFALPVATEAKDIHATYDGADLRIVVKKREPAITNRGH